MLRLKYSLLLLVLTISFSGSYAQDTVDNNGNCEYEAFAAYLEQQAAMLAEAEDPDSVLDDIQDAIDEFRDSCEGDADTIVETGEIITFTSEESGLNAVLGPIELSTGIYRVTATTDGFLIADIQEVSGTCDTGFSGLFNIFNGQAETGAQNLLLSTGCNALIEISNVQSAWTLDFELINLNQIIEVEDAYNSDDIGLQPVIGPVEIPTGTYRVTATTDGFLIADIEELDGTCDTGFSGLFNIFSDQAIDGAETILNTVDCVGLIKVGNTNAPWTLEFDQLND